MSKRDKKRSFKFLDYSEEDEDKNDVGRQKNFRKKISTGFKIERH